MRRRRRRTTAMPLLSRCDEIGSERQAGSLCDGVRVGFRYTVTLAVWEPVKFSLVIVIVANL